MRAHARTHTDTDTYEVGISLVVFFSRGNGTLGTEATCLRRTEGGPGQSNTVVHASLS